MMKIYQLLLVGIGGALGSMLRYLFSLLTAHFITNKSLFSWKTFGVNIIGCLIIGIFFELGQKNQWFSSNLQLLFVVGFCGGFTTFSSYMLDALIISKDSFLISIIYIVSSICIGLLALLLGAFITRTIV